MASQLNIFKKSWNPFEINSTELPANLLLASKLIVLGLIVKGYGFKLSDHFLPLLPIFDSLGSQRGFEITLQVIFVLFSVLLLFNKRVRLCCLILGLLFLIVPLSSRISYRNSKVFVGCILFLISLHKRGDDLWLLRTQLALVYLGSGLNKLLQADWLSGQYFEYWMSEIVHRVEYIALSAQLPKMMLARIMSWVTIVTEFFLAVGFVVRPLFRIAVWIGIYFHGCILILAGSDFGIFTIAILASYLIYVDWPQQVDILDKGILQVDGQTFSGFQAFKRRLFYNPITHFCAVLILGLPRGELGGEVRSLICIILLIVFCPLNDYIFKK